MAKAQTAKSPKMVKVTNRRLVEIGEGLKAISMRALPSRLVEQRVAIYWARLRPLLQAYDKGLKPLTDREALALQLPEGDPEREAKLALIYKEIDDFKDGLVEIQVPRERLIEDDLPRALKTKDGQGLLNATGASMVRVLLSPEFFDLTDPDPVPKEDEEPDMGDARDGGGEAGTQE
jgi:hypothetical protein